MSDEMVTEYTVMRKLARSLSLEMRRLLAHAIAHEEAEMYVGTDAHFAWNRVITAMHEAGDLSVEDPPRSDFEVPPRPLHWIEVGPAYGPMRKLPAMLFENTEEFERASAILRGESSAETRADPEKDES